jgi:hypothetical protein
VFSTFRLKVSMIYQDRLGTPARRKGRAPFWSHLYIKAIFYQDRLGTNIGKTPKKTKQNLVLVLSFTQRHGVARAIRLQAGRSLGAGGAGRWGREHDVVSAVCKRHDSASRCAPQAGQYRVGTLTRLNRFIV